MRVCLLDGAPVTLLTLSLALGALVLDLVRLGALCSGLGAFVYLDLAQFILSLAQFYFEPGARFCGIWLAVLFFSVGRFVSGPTFLGGVLVIRC